MGFVVRLPRFWRVYAVMGVFLALAAVIVHQVAKVSWFVAALAVLGGMFANGLLILCGDQRSQRDRQWRAPPH
jgi:hypothetical protein